MLKKWIALFLTTLLMITACTHSPVYNQAEGNVADVKVKMSELRHKSDNLGKSQPSLIVKDGLYVDTSPISLDRDPEWLRSHIVIRGDQLPFSYFSRTIAGGAPCTILTKYQVGLDTATSVTMNYSGNIKGALDLLAAKTGFTYTIHGKSIYWQAFITKTYDVAFMPGGTDYMMGKSSGGSSSAGGSNTSTPAGSTTSNFTTSDSSDAEYSNLKGTLSVWTDLENTIKQIMSPEGKVVVSQSTTSVTVRDRPSNVELVGQFIRNMNRNLSKQVLVKVQVLQVDLQSDYNYGIDWNLIVRSFHNSNFVVNGNYGNPVAITALTPQTNINGGIIPTPQFGTQVDNPLVVPGYTILLNALSQQGKTSVVTEPRVVCLNNQVSVVRIVKQVGYVASVQNTSLAGSSSGGASTNIGTVTSQITPGNIITGLTLYILPKIMNDKIYLQVNADLSTQDALVNFTSGGSTVQLPTISEKHFNQRSMIRSGDSLILSGFRQVGNRAAANQFLQSQALGGKASQENNSETIVLITPYILNGSA